MMNIGLAYSCMYNVTDGEKKLAYFSQDSVTKFDFHVFELILCNTKSLSCSNRRERFYKWVFPPPGNFRTVFRRQPEGNYLFTISCLHRLVLG